MVRVKSSNTGGQDAGSVCLFFFFFCIICSQTLHMERLPRELAKTQSRRLLLKWFWFSTLGPWICIYNKLIGNVDNSLKLSFWSCWFGPWVTSWVRVFFLEWNLPPHGWMFQFERRQSAFILAGCCDSLEKSWGSRATCTRESVWPPSQLPPIPLRPVQVSCANCGLWAAAVFFLYWLQHYDQFLLNSPNPLLPPLLGSRILLGRCCQEFWLQIPSWSWFNMQFLHPLALMDCSHS